MILTAAAWRKRAARLRRTIASGKHNERQCDVLERIAAQYDLIARDIEARQ